MAASTPRPPRGTRKLPRAERERQILDAASQAFGQRGYAATSISDLATAVGVSKALILTYFGSKDGLHAACVNRAGAALVDGVEAAIATTRPAADMAEATFAAVFSALAERPADWNVLFDRSAPTDTEGAATSQRVRTALEDQALRGVAAAVGLRGDAADDDDAALLTEVWMSAVNAVIDWWIRHPDHSADDMIDRSRRLLATIRA